MAHSSCVETSATAKAAAAARNGGVCLENIGLELSATRAASSAARVSSLAVVAAAEASTGLFSLDGSGRAALLLRQEPPSSTLQHSPPSTNPMPCSVPINKRCCK